MHVLIDERQRDPPADRERHVEEVPHRPETEREARLAQSHRHGLEARAEVLGHERAAPDRERKPGEGEQLDLKAERGRAVVDEEHLDEDRRVADHLDVDRSELAEEWDPVRASSAKDEPDPIGGDDADQAGFHRELEGAPELVAALPDDGPIEGGEDSHAKQEWPPRGGHSFSDGRRSRWGSCSRAGFRAGTGA